MGARPGGGRRRRPTAGAALNGPPQLSLSRLVCPRLLTANTDYLACVVPTFELGRKAGLGLPIADTELTGTNALATGMDADRHRADAGRQLPVYYSWQFRTGEGGDFEVAGAPVENQRPDGTGPANRGDRQARFQGTEGLDPKTTVKVEGALMPLTGNSAPVVWSDPAAPAFELELSKIVNKPGLNQVIAPTADPLLAPPLYGRWHAGRAVVTPAAANWLDSLNLDPRWRIGGGARHAGDPGPSGSADGVGLGAGRRDSAGQPAPAAAPDEHGRRREPARAASLDVHAKR